MSTADGGARRLTLAIDAATYVGSVAVIAGGEVVSEREAAMRGERAERLMPALADALRAAGAGPADVERVVCGGGPGSFTSLRIAASIAKGVAAARGVPLQAVSSLWLIAAGARPRLEPGEYLAVLDAMRGEWFGARVTVESGGAVRAPGAWRLYSAAELDAHRDAGVRLIGARAPEQHRPHARGVAAAAAAGAGVLQAVALDGWEPDYGRKAEAQVRWEAEHGRPLAPD